MGVADAGVPLISRTRARVHLPLNSRWVPHTGCHRPGGGSPPSDHRVHAAVAQRMLLQGILGHSRCMKPEPGFPSVPASAMTRGCCLFVQVPLGDRRPHAPCSNVIPVRVWIASRKEGVGVFLFPA